MPPAQAVAAKGEGDDVTRVAVFGANGRMGAEVCRAVQVTPGLELVAAVDKKKLGLKFKPIRREMGFAAAIDIAVCYLEEMDTTPDATPVSEIDQMF